MKYFVILLILISFSAIASAEPVPEPEPRHNSTAYENCGPGTTLQNGICVVDKSHNTTINSSGIWGGIMEYPAHHTSIENINGTLYYVSESFELNSNLPSISFHNVLFTSPYTTTPPRYIYSDVVFSDETEETLRVIFTQPDFTEHTKPRAGFVAKSDGYHFLVSVNLEELSPLKQVKSGVSFDETQCKDNLILIQKRDGSPSCVESKTISKLIQRGWIDTDPRAQADKNIPRFLCELYGGGFFDGTGECMDLQSSSKCQMLGGQWDDKCMIPNYTGKGVETEPGFEPRPEPEPKRSSDSEIQLTNARKSLQNAYNNHVNLGPYLMKDAVVGFGTYDDVLIVDIASKYTDSVSFKTVKQEIQHIVGKDVSIDYVVYDEPIERHIETVIPYLWNKILHQKNIDFAPKDQTYWNNADGFAEHDKVCSPLVAPNGTEFFISSTFVLEPFEITGTYIDKTPPEGCHKIWKTDVLMTEPDRVTALWLENEN